MEAKMEMKQEPRGMEMRKVRFWLENQVVITYVSRLDSSEGSQRILESLRLNDFNKTLNTGTGNYNLRSFDEKHVPHPRSSDGDRGNELENSDLNSPVGKYLFSLPSGQGTFVISFFHVERLNQPDSIKADSAPDLVKLLNDTPRVFDTPEASFVASMPNWLNGGTQQGGISHGCPVTPPFPVEESCSRWKMLVPSGFSLPQAGTGKGVTVIVLDTLPLPQDITSAASNPASNNALLYSMAQGMVSNAPFNAMPPAINVNYQDLSQIGIEDLATGKDIYGNLVGFPMVDHGLFVAGIIRDLAPEADIECIRVLNDYGVGNTTILIDALNNIYNRLGSGGDLNGKRVVINMSLVATPADEELAMWGYTPETIQPARAGLLAPIQLLAEQYGVVFVASAGNDSDTRSMDMNPQGFRLMPRYPAAFAYPGVSNVSVSTVIPVGAVDKSGTAAPYSNYPGTNGIATYGGAIPNPHPTTQTSNVVTQIDHSVPVDAIRGVYSSILYPALAVTDPKSIHSSAPFNYPEFQPAPSVTWAYWAGTSFATPIISALAARVLQTWQPSDPSVRDTIINAANQQTQWTKLEPNFETASGPMILVTQQCQPDNNPSIQ
jgi:Subtilase family